MKNLKDICNVNIPNSLHSLLEASILDIEGTMKSGDELSRDLTWEFESEIKWKLEDIKKYYTLSYDKGSEYKALTSIPKIAEFLGIEDDYITVLLKRDNSTGKYNCTIYFGNKFNSQISSIQVSDFKYKNPAQMLKTFILPITQDIYTFTEWLKNNYK